MEELSPILISYPLWEEEVWNALQAKKYPEAEQALINFLSSFTPEEWEGISWRHIIQGAPALRGDLTEQEWRLNVRPLIGRVLVNLAEGVELSFLYQSLMSEFNLLFAFHTVFISQIPGNTPREKLEWLKAEAPSLYTFFLVMPAQEMGIFITPPHHPLPPEKMVNQFESLPDTLKSALFSFQVAESVLTIGRTNHLSDEKINHLGRVVGHALLGLLYIGDLKKEIAAAIFIDIRGAQTFEDEIKEKTLAPYIFDIQRAYTPLDEVLKKITEPATWEEPTGEEVIPETTIAPQELVSPLSFTQSLPVSPPVKPSPETETSIPIFTTAEPSPAPPSKKPEDLKKLFEPRTSIIPPIPPIPSAPVSDTPFILHQETPSTPQKRKSFFANFSLSTFLKKPTQPTHPSVKVNIQLGDDAQTTTPQEPKIVNYTDSHTPYDPFNKDEGMIHLQAAQPVITPSASIFSDKKTPTSPPSQKTESSLDDFIKIPSQVSPGELPSSPFPSPSQETKKNFLSSFTLFGKKSKVITPEQKNEQSADTSPTPPPQKTDTSPVSVSMPSTQPLPQINPLPLAPTKDTSPAPSPLPHTPSNEPKKDLLSVFNIFGKKPKTSELDSIVINDKTSNSVSSSVPASQSKAAAPEQSQSPVSNSSSKSDQTSPLSTDLNTTSKPKA